MQTSTPAQRLRGPWRRLALLCRRVARAMIAPPRCRRPRKHPLLHRHRHRPHHHHHHQHRPLRQHRPHHPRQHPPLAPWCLRRFNRRSSLAGLCVDITPASTAALRPKDLGGRCFRMINLPETIRCRLRGELHGRWFQSPFPLATNPKVRSRGCVISIFQARTAKLRASCCTMPGLASA